MGKKNRIVSHLERFADREVNREVFLTPISHRVSHDLLLKYLRHVKLPVSKTMKNT